MSAHIYRPVREQDVWDVRKARRKRIKFTPRRGHFPMRPEKALMRLTGRKTYKKAFKSFRFYIETRQRQIGMPRFVELRIEEALGSDWTEDEFVRYAIDYVRYPRKGFNAAKQKERILKVFSELGITRPARKLDNKTKG